MLDLTPYLERRPKELSGGQRQRVAMGRAIVRQPQVFLMDEPLSNLDAKLRVQMRADIAKLQRDLGTTTIYVTHDQVEAMTMGDRVAVMSHRRAAAGRHAAAALRPARQPLRRRLHRHAADEPARGATSPRRTARSTLLVGGQRDPALGRGARAATPACAARGGRRVVVGIRPGDLHPAREPAGPADGRRPRLDLIEALGSRVDRVLPHRRDGDQSADRSTRTTGGGRDRGRGRDRDPAEPRRLRSDAREALGLELDTDMPVAVDVAEAAPLRRGVG